MNGEELLVLTMLVPGHDWLGCTFLLFLVPWERRAKEFPAYTLPVLVPYIHRELIWAHDKYVTSVGKCTVGFKYPHCTLDRNGHGSGLWGQHPLFLLDEIGHLTQALVDLVEN